MLARIRPATPPPIHGLPRTREAIHVVGALLAVALAVAVLLTGCGGAPVCLDRSSAGPIATVCAVAGTWLAVRAGWRWAGPAIMRRITGLR